MMHYWFVAGIVITSAVVVYTAYTLYKEAEGQPYYVFEDVNDRRSHNNNQQRSQRNTEEDDVPLNNYKEKSNDLRRRKKKSKNSNSQRSENSPVHSENEEELLDKLSYLNAVEQEIERKKQQLADEERILNEKEREIERRKQNLISSSHSSLSLDSPTEINLLNSNNSTPATAGSINVNEPSPLIIPSPNDLNSPPTDLSPIAPTMSSSLHDEQQRDNENHVYSDMAAHSILTQDLSHISQNQKTSNNYPSVIMKPSSRSVTTNSTISSSQKHLQDDDDYVITKSQLLMRPNIINDSNQSRFMTTTKSIRSEDTWSEIDSVISENIGSSILSSAVDIDMEDVDVIEH
ncbi:4271_t:CDS:2 [Diversispora eburnea]|uniref:4271_t:CDS:1 n=1 Tax=Diversispora eburnea TaxID=1213867 RepID=A0A9N8ZT48_9GLOM|nr:4271_t:CDS:2 [Diversispora eburnea]